MSWVRQRCQPAHGTARVPQAVDVAYIEDIRNHLGADGVPDLAALDIFRGRDAGMSS